MSETLDDQYLAWLYARIGSLGEKRPQYTYWSLFRYLYLKEFVWLIPNDDNRVEDGRDLRYEFLDEMFPMRVDRAWTGMGCSVLELLFGVAKRLAFEADGDIRHWFWELLNNLGLSGYNDRSFNEHRVEDIVDRLIWRTYDPDGRGGLFPLEHPNQDQRMVEIWYQLCNYILERR